MTQFRTPSRFIHAAASPLAAPASDLMTLAEAASYLRICGKTLRGLIKQGRIPATRVGKQYRLRKKALDDYLASGKI